LNVPESTGEPAPDARSSVRWGPERCAGTKPIHAGGPYADVWLAKGRKADERKVDERKEIERKGVNRAGVSGDRSWTYSVCSSRRS